MGRILAIDYGMKRTGIAVTDPLQLIATALDTVETGNVVKYLKGYLEREPVDSFVVGLPKRLNNQDTDMTQPVRQFVEELGKVFPNLPIAMVDERFTSSIAKRAMIDGGMKKMDRRVKGNVDKISATLILQSYLEGPNNKGKSLPL
ncbi:MAG: Holliday junction resolvase RuvX [Cytophagales bacterium]|nr:Holliday junction resolvase RuvX [Cytophagales bacterium]